MIPFAIAKWWCLGGCCLIIFVRELMDCFNTSFGIVEVFISVSGFAYGFHSTKTQKLVWFYLPKLLIIPKYI